MSNINNLDSYEQVASIKVVGVGGAGNNAINRMIEDGVQGVDFIAANTDAQVLSISKAPQKIILGKELTKGLGAGSNPDIGRQAALESVAEIESSLKNADMVFIAAGMGGGTGTGSAPVIAKIAKDLGSLTVGIINTPFKFEGRSRNGYALQGIEELRKYVDSLLIISNDRLIDIIGGVPLKDSFREADNILRQGVQTITDLIAVPALINLDFADVKNVMQGKGNALFGIGIGEGEDKAITAANKAIISPLLEDASIRGAKDAIVNITGSSVTLLETNDAIDIIRQAAGGDINIIYGTAINEHLEDQMIVTIIATGFDGSGDYDLDGRGSQPENDPESSYDDSDITPKRPSFYQSNQNHNRFIKPSKEEFINTDNGYNSNKDKNKYDYDETKDNDIPDFLRKRY